MTIVRYFGDIHGNLDWYAHRLAECPHPTVQVGDYGIGFVKNKIPRSFDPARHRFIRGNHDNPAKCTVQENWIADGTVETTTTGNKIMYIGGASSIDRAYRIEGISWWEDEQCSVQQLNEFVDSYIQIKPDIMITHECPESIADALCAAYNKTKFADPSRTRQAFESMLYHHRPKLWCFGHWHHDLDWLYQGTRFVCLDEFSHIDININGDLWENDIVSGWRK